MRRFIVLFLLLVLPLQVLSASIDDLNAVHSRPSHASAAGADPALGDIDLKSVKAPMPADPGNPSPAHADLNDSVDIADVDCSRRDRSVCSRPRYIDTVISDVFLAIIKPPVI